MLTLVVIISRLMFHSSNMVTVQVVNNGHAQSTFLQQCLKKVMYVLATNEVELKVVHIPGVETSIADMLSRWHLEPNYEYLS